LTLLSKQSKYRKGHCAQLFLFSKEVIFKAFQNTECHYERL